MLEQVTRGVSEVFDSLCKYYSTFLVLIDLFFTETSPLFEVSAFHAKALMRTGASI